MDPYEYDVYEHSERASQHMAKVYGWMFAGLFLTAMISFITLTTPLIYLVVNPVARIVALVGQVGLVIFLSARAMKMERSTAILSFLGYSALNGFVFSIVFFVYTEASILLTFGFAAAAFGVMSIYGTVTKKDLTSVGSFFLMGLVGIVLASIVNFFLRSPALYYGISYLGIAIFLGLTAYDTQKIRQYHAQFAGTEREGNVAILGALTLYLDFINLFLYLLRIMGRRR